MSRVRGSSVRYRGKWIRVWRNEKSVNFPRSCRERSYDLNSGLYLEPANSAWLAGPGAVEERTLWTWWGGEKLKGVRGMDRE